MTLCDDVSVGIEDYLDGEIRIDRLTSFEEHLRGCADCSARLVEHLHARRVTRETLDELAAEAPAPPPDLATRMAEALAVPEVLDSPGEVSATGRRSRRMPRSLLAVFGSAAAIVLVVVGFSLVPRRDVDASPIVALARAAEHYGTLEDVELWVRFESEALDALGRLFGNSKSKGKSKGKGDGDSAADGESEDKWSSNKIKPIRIFAQAPTRFLYQKVEDLEAPLDDFIAVGGFDGERSWCYDAGASTVAVGPEGADGLGHVFEIKNTSITFSHSGDEKGLNLMSFLSWGFLSDLERGQGFVAREITWPSDRRAGRRVFRVEPDPDDDEETSFIWAASTVTIDASDSLIERMVIELSLGPVSLFTLTMEVAATNQGLPPSLFDYSTHTPAGVDVVESPKSESR